MPLLSVFLYIWFDCYKITVQKQSMMSAVLPLAEEFILQPVRRVMTVTSYSLFELSDDAVNCQDDAFKRHVLFPQANACKKKPLKLILHIQANNKIYHCIISVSFSTKCCLFHYFILFCSNNIHLLFINHHLSLNTDPVIWWLYGVSDVCMNVYRASVEW